MIPMGTLLLDVLAEYVTVWAHCLEETQFLVFRDLRQLLMHFSVHLSQKFLHNICDTIHFGLEDFICRLFQDYHPRLI